MAGATTFIDEQQKKAARERGDLIRQQLGKLKRKGVTLTKVAKRAGVSRTYLYKLINAKIITPAISTLSKIEKVLELEHGELLCRTYGFLSVETISVHNNGLGAPGPFDPGIPPPPQEEKILCDHIGRW